MNSSKVIEDKTGFANLYDYDTSLKIGIFFSLLNMVTTTPLLYSITWYVKYGTNHHNTLLNQLIAVTCWNGIVYNIFSEPLQILVTSFGPFDEWVCFVQMIVKNIHILHLLLVTIAMTIVKYLYIFVMKNPGAFICEYWCLFINLAIILLASISELVFGILPGTV